MWYLIILIIRKVIDLFTNEYSDAADLPKEVREEVIEQPFDKHSQRYFWIIDPGHGKLTEGKRSPVTADGRQLLEYEFNYEIATMIVRSLNKRKIKAIITINDPSRHGNDLSYRVKVANEFNIDLPKIYVSIHGNAGPSKGFSRSFRGIETYYFSPLGKRIAEIFQDRLVFRSGLKNRGTKKAGFFVLKHTNHPAILTENGFFNNPDEFELMMTKEFRRIIADAHVEAILHIEKHGL